ncbi:MAG: gamma-glutamyltransferase, partial [Cryobacterium sp.]|nr:gamma-glutamyltransferase [Cryobacterium sp.]
MSFSAPPEFTTRPTLRGSFGMVASTHWLGTAAGQAVLERGGNAFDAAVACAFVLQVVEPHLNGPGGDLVGIFSTSEEPGEPIVLMGQGPAPSQATIDHYRAEGLSSIPGAGGLAAAVPGATDAWLLLLRDYGTWELEDVLKFAIDYSRSGFPILDRVVATIETVASLFRENWTSSADLWLPDGNAPARGSHFQNLPLARTFERLAKAAKGTSRASRIDAARAEWSEGFVAETAEKFLAMPHRHSNGADLPGVITAADFAAFRAQFETAVCADFRGVTIAKAGPWSQGPALLEMLGILDGFPDDELDPASAAGAHNILEAEKLALADRDSYFGDSNQGVLSELLSPEYLAGRRALIGPEASREFRPGLLSTQLPFIPPLNSADRDQTARSGKTPPFGEPTVEENGETKGDTCHLDVVDRWGNLVSVTPSGGWLQSSPAFPELG